MTVNWEVSHFAEQIIGKDHGGYQQELKNSQIRNGLEKASQYM